MYKSRDRVLLSEKEKFDERRDLKKGESSFEKVIEQSLKIQPLKISKYQETEIPSVSN